MQFLPVFFFCLLYYPPLRILNQCCLTTHAATLADQSAQCGEKKTYIKSSENSKKIACFLWLYFGVDPCNGIYSWNGNTALVAIITPVFLLNWSYRDYFWTKCIAHSMLCLKQMVSINISLFHIIHYSHNNCHWIFVVNIWPEFCWQQTLISTLESTVLH